MSQPSRLGGRQVRGKLDNKFRDFCLVDKLVVRLLSSVRRQNLQSFGQIILVRYIMLKSSECPTVVWTEIMAPFLCEHCTGVRCEAGSSQTNDS